MKLLKNFTRWSNISRLYEHHYGPYLYSEERWKVRYSSGSIINVNQLPRSLDEIEDLPDKVKSPKNSQLLRIAVVGVPNCGKSAVINALVRSTACTVSSTKYTTRTISRSSFIMGNTQLIFIDTPGVESPADCNRLHIAARIIPADPITAAGEADVIAVVQDTSNKDTRDHLNPHILKLLVMNSHIPSILLLNKIDIVKSKSTLLFLIKQLTENKLQNGKIVLDNQKILQTLNKKLSSLNETLEFQLNQMSNNSSEMNSSDAKGNMKPDVYNNSTIKNTNKSQGNNSTNNKSKLIESSSSSSSNTTSNPMRKDVYEGKPRLNKQQAALQFAQNRTGWPGFQNVFMVSSRTSEGMSNMRELLSICSYPSTWIFNKEAITDRSPYEIVITTFRSKFMEAIRSDFIYLLQYTITKWEFKHSNSPVLEISVTVQTPKKQLIATINKDYDLEYKRANIEIKNELEELLNCEVVLEVEILATMGSEEDYYWAHRRRSNTRGSQVTRLLMEQEHVDKGKNFNEMYLKYIKYFLL